MRKRPHRRYSASPAILSESPTCLSKEGVGNPGLPPILLAPSRPPPPSVPPRTQGNLCPFPCTQGKARKGFSLSLVPQRGAGGAASAGGTACPPVPQNVGGRSGRDSGAGQARPSPQGGRKPQQDRPSRLCPHPLAKSERLCYNTPMKSTTGPLLFPGACPYRMDREPTAESPPVAWRPGGMFPQPRNPPGKPGAGADAVARQAPCSHPAQRRIRDGYATDARWLRDGYAMDARWLRDGYATAPCLKTPISG